MRKNNQPHENTPPKRAPRVTGRSSVYPYRTQRFITNEKQLKLPVGKGKEIPLVTRETTSDKNINGSKKDTIVPFPHSRIEETISWLRNKELFLDIDILATQAHEMRLRIEKQLENSSTKMLTPIKGVSAKREKNQLDMLTSSTHLLPFNEEAYAHKILEKKTTLSGDKKKDNLNYSTTQQNFYNKDNTSQYSKNDKKEDSPIVEPMMSLQEIAYGTTYSIRNEEKENSPIILEVKEEINNECTSPPLLSLSSCFAVQYRASVSGGVATDNSFIDDDDADADGAVSLRDASPPRGGLTGNDNSCMTDLFHLVQIPRAHYILLQVNFSSW